MGIEEKGKGERREKGVDYVRRGESSVKLREIKLDCLGQSD